MIESLYVLYSLEELTCFSILNALASSDKTPASVMKTITNSLILCALKSDSSPTRDLHHLLASLQQRHPELVQEVSCSLIEEDEDQQEAIQQLVLSLSVVRSVYSLLSYLFFMHFDRKLRTKETYQKWTWWLRPWMRMPRRVLQQSRVCFVLSAKAPALIPRTWSAHPFIFSEAYVHRLILSRSLYVLHSLHVYTILLSPYSRHCTPIRRSFSLSCYPIRPRSSRLSPKQSPRSLSRLPVLSCACTFLSSLYT